jgi:cytochrome c-type biogenesis protein CcsB
VVLALAALFYLVRIFKEEKLFDFAAGSSLAVGVILLAAGIAQIFYQDAKMAEISVRVEPFLMALLFFLWLIAGGMLMLHFLNEGIIERLPDVDRLDFLSYRSVVVAFPLMTIVIVTGAVWAQSAWGRYWGWDPKETASLVTWFVYAIYLHSRIVAGWKGRPTAIISIVGFLSVIFTYLGVNVFLSGLHSYASSF